MENVDTYKPASRQISQVLVYNFKNLFSIWYSMAVWFVKIFLALAVIPLNF